jgi:hypothetical protein
MTVSNRLAGRSFIGRHANKSGSFDELSGNTVGRNAVTGERF